MDKKEENYEADFPTEILSEEEAFGLSEILKKIIGSYVSSRDKMTVEEWLPHELQKQLPEKAYEEIKDISDEIINSLKATEEMKKSQQKAVAVGRSKESWFASAVLQSASHMSAQDSAKFLYSLDDAVCKANAAMLGTVTTKSSGNIIPSMNPNLDGFIAEQYHVNSFNMNAAAKGSALKAEVQSSTSGRAYTKNGFDVVLKDASGKRIHQYQMKYGATAEDTIRMIRSGNYGNQTLVVPEEQVAAVQEAFPNKTVTSVIGDGTVLSKPLTKEQAKDLQKKAQSGNFMEVGWNDYAARDIAIGIGKQAGYACLQGAAIGAGMEIAAKAWNNEPIDGEEVVEAAIVNGADFGVKAAAAGALKAASEKGILKAIPKGTSGLTFANIAFTAVENIKVLSKVATGELTGEEGLDAIGQTSVSCVAGIAVSAKGAAVGSTIGAVFGPIGSAVGGFVGGTVGYIAGSGLGHAVAKGFKVVGGMAIDAVKSAGSALIDGIKDFASGVACWFGF